MNAKRWRDWVMLVLGVWLFFSPSFLGYVSTTSTAAWNSYLLGAAVTFFASMALMDRRVWEEWVNLALGVWLIIAPFVLRYSPDSAATWNHVILGLLIGADALWAIARPEMERTA